MKAALSRLGYVLMAAGLGGLILARSVFSPAAVVTAGQALAVGLMLWARLTFGRRSFHATATPTEGGLVTTGPYHFIRHPIYSSVCLFTWVSVAGHLSALSIGLALVVSLGTAIRIVAEENLLRARYPEYAAYASRTRRLVPFLF
jgi:protein-S-isoprenylcysteine O-methyltransferase Ste14